MMKDICDSVTEYHALKMFFFKKKRLKMLKKNSTPPYKNNAGLLSISILLMEINIEIFDQF